jgi:L-rhamnose mutarotase
MKAAAVRYALALDLVDDEAKIAAYEKAHESIWPEVREHLLAQGVLAMEIYRLGTRMFMVMEVNPAVYAEERMARASLENEAIVRWETLMWTFQSPTPWTPAGQKWVRMRRVFQLE